MAATMASLSGERFDRILEFGQILVAANWFATPGDVVYYFEKPWKYDREYGIWLHANEPDDTHDEWATFIEQLNEEE